MPKIRCSYQLHIQLCDAKPAIWRRLVIADSTTLAQLHQAIQAAMGWQNRQRYAFEIAGQHYGLPDADTPDDPTMDARRYTIGQLLQGQALAVRYVHGSGNGWIHRIKLEARTPIGSPEALSSLPICLGGRNACPPEDCGGSAAFAQHLQALQDPNASQASPLRLEGWNAKHFDLTAVQARLHALQLPARSQSKHLSDAVTA